MQVLTAIVYVRGYRGIPPLKQTELTIAFFKNYVKVGIGQHQYRL